MLETLYLVLKDDLVYYPPVLSILHVCAEAGRPVVFIGDRCDVLPCRPTLRSCPPVA